MLLWLHLKGLSEKSSVSRSGSKVKVVSALTHYTLLQFCNVLIISKIILSAYIGWVSFKNKVMLHHIVCFRKQKYLILHILYRKQSQSRLLNNLEVWFRPFRYQWQWCRTSILLDITGELIVRMKIQTNLVNCIANLPNFFIHLTRICDYSHQTNMHRFTLPPYSTSVHMLATWYHWYLVIWCRRQIFGI